jgi:putative hydrolase of the HAD superfamily
MSLSSLRADGIRAITFDVGDTLIRATPSVGEIYAGICLDHGVDLDPDLCNRTFEATWRRRSVESPPGRDRFTSGERGEDGWWEDLVREVMAECGIPPERVPPIDTFREAFADPGSWKIYDEVPASLEALQESGYELAVLSNWDSRLPALLEKLGLTRYFSRLFVSAVAGVEKPDGRFFDLAARELGMDPDEVLHVGDRIREDYDGALDAGMAALWLDRRGNGKAAASRVDPRHVITSLAEVAGRIDSPRGDE